MPNLNQRDAEMILERLDRNEREHVRDLGDAIGYGRVMQLAESLWRDKLAAQDPRLAGGEHSVGCCAAFLVTCPCVEECESGERTVRCDWCCGSGRVTRKVFEAMTANGGDGA